MQQNRKKLLILILGLLFIYFTAIYIKSHLFRSQDRKDIYSPFYHTENATHFRYTEMISRGVPVPENDIKAQYPDGFEVFKRSSIFEEYIAGYLHRLPAFNKVPLHRFIEFFNWCFSSLAVFAVFLLCFCLTKDKWLSLISTLYYAISSASIVRTVNGFYLREIVAFPLIAFHIYFTFKSLVSGKTMDFTVTAVLVFFVMASWQMAQFYLVIIIIFPVIKYLLTKKTDKLRRQYLKFYTIQAGGLILAGLLVPYLRNRTFITSMPLFICYAFILMLIIEKYQVFKIWQKTGLFLLVCIGLFLVIPRNREYSYIYEFFLYKIRYFFKKPSDPAKLPFIIKTLWSGPFNTPNLKNAVYILSTYLLWGIVAVGYIVWQYKKEKQLDTSRLFILYLTVAFFGAYLISKRIYIFFIVALVIDFCFLISIIKIKRLKKRIVVFGIIGFCLFFEFYKTWTSSSSKPFFTGLFDPADFSMEEEQFIVRNETGIDLIEWINENTATNDTILARYALSPTLLIYTGRPVYLSPLFDRISSDRIEEFNTSYYKKEENFYKVCEKYKVKYFVYYIDIYLNNSFYSTRYMANKMDYSKDEVAYHMQFHPEELKYFELMYQNEVFRIYKVVYHGKKVRNDNQVKEYYAVYDEDAFFRMGRSEIEFLLRWNDSFSIYMQAYQYFARRRFQEAGETFQIALEIFPYYPQAWIHLGKIALARRQNKEAYKYYNRALAISDMVEARYGLAFLNLVYGFRNQAKKELTDILRRDKCYMPAIMDLAVIFSHEKDYDRAIQLCRQGISCKPDYLKSYELLARIYKQAGRETLADKVYQDMEARKKMQ